MPATPDQVVTAGLNESQLRAVTFGDGPLLVVAGAGSGKTRVITHRIAYLIENAVPPSRILGITFTNRAASEMEQRVEKMVGRGVTIKTFHAFCAMLLRRQIHHMGRENSFTIYDRSDSLRVVKRRCKALNLDPDYYKPGEILDSISAHKDRLESPADAARRAVSKWDGQAVRIYEQYESELAANNALDFDDLLVQTVRLFDQHPRVLAHYQQLYQYLLVDEYQDTNQAQHVIARALQGKHRNITAVGDPDQMIYTWRGARMENIMHFDREYPAATVIKLERNYRSTANILRAASHAVGFNKLRHKKRLYTEAQQGNPVRIAGCPDAVAEAEWIAEKIRGLTDNGPEKNGIGVLYRTKNQSREFEAVFSRHGIPYQVVDTTGFFERKAVKDIAAYLHLVVNPKDEVALRRIINVPARGIGAKTIQRIQEIAQGTGKTMHDAILDPGSISGLPTRARKAVEKFASMVKELSRACSGAGDVRGAVERVIDTTDYLSAFKQEEKKQTRELLEYFLAFAEQYEQENPEGGLVGFMEQSVLASDADAWKPDAGTVSLLTLHSAKGLEFDVVFLAGVEDRILPHPRALEDRGTMDEDEAMEEERRLFHVGMTRAREQLFLSYACERMIRGKLEVTGESPFLMELPNEGVLWEQNMPAPLTPLSGGSGRQRRSPSKRWKGNGTASKAWKRRGKKAKTKRRPAKVPADVPAAENGGMQPGKEIRHNKYGKGTIVSVSNAGKRKVLRIDFPDYGVLTILE